MSPSHRQAVNFFKCAPILVQSKLSIWRALIVPLSAVTKTGKCGELNEETTTHTQLEKDEDIGEVTKISLHVYNN